MKTYRVTFTVEIKGESVAEVVAHARTLVGDEFVSGDAPVVTTDVEELDDVETVECALCARVVPVIETHAPADDAICASCNEEIAAEADTLDVER